MTCPDLHHTIRIPPQERGLHPRFAASCGNLFLTFIENNQVSLRCSPNSGEDLSGKKILMDVSGPVNFLRIAAKDEIAVIAVLEQTAAGLCIRGVTGKIIPPRDPGELVADFDHTPCTALELDGASFENIMDLAIRINDDGTSDDFVIMRSRDSVTTAHTGHHPHP